MHPSRNPPDVFSFTYANFRSFLTSRSLALYELLQGCSSYHQFPLHRLTTPALPAPPAPPAPPASSSFLDTKKEKEGYITQLKCASQKAEQVSDIY